MLLDRRFRKTHMPWRRGDEPGRARCGLRTTLRTRVIAASLGVTVAGAGAYAASNWVVGVASASSGQARSASNANLIISATAAPAPNNLLYPGAAGDAVVTIVNPNPYPVTITAVQLPADTSDATGYTTSALTTPVPGCLASTPSMVAWNFASPVSGSSHALATPLTVGASGSPDDPLSVILTDDAIMGTSAPLACADTYLSMPSLAGVTASGGSAIATTSPAIDDWSS